MENARIPAGPLNIDPQTNKVTTVMGTELNLSPTEVKALYILATHEGQFVKFDTLYNKVWNTAEKPFDRFEALHAMNNLLRQVEKHGEGFVWIEQEINSGFTYRSQWGHNWKGTSTKSNKRPRLLKRTIGAMGLIAAAMVIMFSPLFSRSDIYEPLVDEFIYLIDLDVPLGTLPPYLQGMNGDAKPCEYCEEYEEDCECGA